MGHGLRRAYDEWPGGTAECPADVGDWRDSIEVPGWAEACGWDEAGGWVEALGSPEEAFSAGAGQVGELDASEFAQWRHRLVSGKLPGQEIALIALLRELEDLKSLACAVQARAAVAFDHARRSQEANRGIPPSRRGLGIGSEVALARGESPHRGGRLMGLARALVHELPATCQALAEGTLNEWRATLIARETACLDPADRAIADTWLGQHLSDNPALGDRQLVADTRRKVIELDQHAVLRRRSDAAGERRVTLRPLPAGMVQLTAILPLTQGISVYATLKDAATSTACTQPDLHPADANAIKPHHAGVSKRPGRGAQMADALVELVCGQPAQRRCTVELVVVITDQALLAGSEEPAHVDGYGPMPAQWVRDLVVTDPDQQIALQRLFRQPGRTIQLESSRRFMTPGLRRLIAIRDQHCRTPWCDAPIRHHDHIKPRISDGPTSLLNGQGLCEACNYTKQATGWTSTAHHDPQRGHTITLTTPTGHTYRSTQPTGPAS